MAVTEIDRSETDGAGLPGITELAERNRDLSNRSEMIVGLAGGFGIEKPTRSPWVVLSDNVSFDILADRHVWAVGYVHRVDDPTMQTRRYELRLLNTSASGAQALIDEPFCEVPDNRLDTLWTYDIAADEGGTDEIDPLLTEHNPDKRRGIISMLRGWQRRDRIDAALTDFENPLAYFEHAASNSLLNPHLAQVVQQT